ncbi:MAG: ribonuclease P protein component [Solitalea-like symbiont of Tyrophagus putrescentiae]
MVVDKSFSYNRRERLSGSLVRKVILTGKSVYIKPYKIYWLYAPGTKLNFYPVRASVVIGKRIVPKAAKRNRIRRLIKEAYRINKLDLYSHISSNYPSLQLLLVINFINRNINHKLININDVKLEIKKLIQYFLSFLSKDHK